MTAEERFIQDMRNLLGVPNFTVEAYRIFLASSLDFYDRAKEAEQHDQVHFPQGSGE